MAKGYAITPPAPHPPTDPFPPRHPGPPPFLAASGIGTPAMARGYAITATAPNLATDRFPARHLVPVPFVGGSGSFAPRRTTRHPRSDGSPWFERPGTCTDNDVPLRSCGRPARDLDG